jgi:predicted O-methyltransferase YrrM
MSRLLRFVKRYGIAAAGAVYAFTFGMRSSRHRALVHGIAAHFGHDDQPPRLLPVVGIDDVTSPETRVMLAEPMGVDGNVSLLELLVIARLVGERVPRSLFEIGTFDGRTTLALAANAPDDAVVYTLDLPAGTHTQLSLAPAERQFVDKSGSGTRLRGHSASGKVRQLFGDSAALDFRPYAAQLVFVDGSHAYEYVLEDSETALGMVWRGGGGVVLWHDYGSWEGVTRALNELHARDARFSGLRSIAGTTLAILDAGPA